MPNKLSIASSFRASSASSSGLRSLGSRVSGVSHHLQLGSNWATVQSRIPEIARGNEAIKILEMLKQSELFQTLPEKTQKAIITEHERKSADARRASQSQFGVERSAVDLDNLKSAKSADSVFENDKQKTEVEEEHRLDYLWSQRTKKKNWTLLILFHVTVLMNFLICFLESYWMTVEKAIYARMYLDGDLNCMKAIPSSDNINHIFNVIHGLICVAVLYADTLSNSNICWAMVFVQLAHAINDGFQFTYNYRFEERHNNWTKFTFVFIFEILGCLVFVHRYYDMTDLLAKRKLKYTSTAYGGRTINDQIIYENESTFLQQKFTQRQANALQIYGVIQKIEHYKARGLEPDPNELNIDIKAAIAALRDVQELEGLDKLKELKKRNAKRLKELKNVMVIDHRQQYGPVQSKVDVENVDLKQ